LVHVSFIRMLTEPLISSSRSFGTPARASTTESVNKHASMTQVIKADLGLQSFGNPSTRCRHNPLSLTDKRRCHQECRAQASRSQRKAKCMGKMSSACARPAEDLRADRNSCRLAAQGSLRRAPMPFCTQSRALPSSPTWLHRRALPTDLRRHLSCLGDCTQPPSARHEVSATAVLRQPLPNKTRSHFPLGKGRQLHRTCSALARQSHR